MVGGRGLREVKVIVLTLEGGVRDSREREEGRRKKGREGESEGERKRRGIDGAKGGEREESRWHVGL